MLTMKRVNQALTAKYGEGIELVRGEGYFYFMGNLVPSMPSVFVYRLNHLSLDRWLYEAEAAIAAEE